jgi:hypothetical protein
MFRFGFHSYLVGNCLVVNSFQPCRHFSVNCPFSIPFFLLSFPLGHHFILIGFSVGLPSFLVSFPLRHPLLVGFSFSLPFFLVGFLLGHPLLVGFHHVCLPFFLFGVDLCPVGV